jgi:hypothetical protein
MSHQLINDMLHLNFLRNYNQSVNDGRFSVVNDSLVTVKAQGSSFSCDVSLTTDFQIAGKSARTDVVMGHPDYSGYNKKFITEHGCYDACLAVTEFARTTIEKRMVNDDTFAVLNRQEQGDNQSAFLMNMLISWLKAHIHERCNGDGFNFSVKTSPYADSHVIVPLDQMAADHVYDIELGEPVPEDKFMTAHWTCRTKENYWQRPYVLHYNKTGTAQEAFYLIHTLGRTKSSALNFDRDLPGVDTNQLLLDAAGGDGVSSANFDEIPWENAATLWSWIQDYVFLNRLSQSFAACLETLGAMAYQPNWSSMEACQWQQAQLVLAIAKFQPTRARIRTNLEGDPYKPFAGADEYLLTEARDADKFLVTSALASYYMWLGTYTIVANEALSRGAWRTAFTSNGGPLHILRTPAMRPAAISSVIGREYASCMNYSCSMHVDVSRVGDVHELRDCESPDNSLPKTIPINGIFAPVSGSLCLGTISGEFEFLQHLKALQEIPGSEPGEEILSPVVVTQIANMYRLFGHDTVWVDNNSGEQVYPWATSRECVIEPASVDTCLGPRKALLAWSSHLREGRNHLLPNVNTLLRSGGAQILIQAPTLRLTEYGSRTKELRPVARNRRPPVQLKFLVKAPLVYDPVTYRARPLNLASTQNFHRVMSEVPAVKPEGPRVEARLTGAVDTASDQDGLAPVAE